MTLDLESIALSANAVFATSPGFMCCAVRSCDPPVIEFRLASDVNARRFKGHLEGHNAGVGFRHEIDQRVWFVVDELDALGAMDGLKNALARLRKFGGRCVLGFQSTA
jgi:hypothetical protein